MKSKVYILTSDHYAGYDFSRKIDYVLLGETNQTLDQLKKEWLSIGSTYPFPEWLIKEKHFVQAEWEENYVRQ